MKNLLIAIALLLTTTCFAQADKYAITMKDNIALLDSAKTQSQKLTLSNTFEQIANAEKNKWHPYYYAALLQLLRCYDTQESKLESLDTELDRADKLLASAEAISPNNSEITCLKSMAKAGRILANRMRGASYGPKSTTLAKEAVSQNPNNPRAYFMLGQCIFNTPGIFGGGKSKAKPQFEKSIALFKTFKPATELDPTWGKEQAESLLKQCE